MAPSPLNPELLGFLGLNVSSVEQLEILCLLVENPARAWSRMEVFRKIQSTEESVQNCLEKFTARGLASQRPDGSYLFSGSAPQSTQAIAIVKMYRERPVSVIESIYSQPLGAARNFADAFRLRKEK